MTMNSEFVEPTRAARHRLFSSDHDTFSVLCGSVGQRYPTIPLLT